MKIEKLASRSLDEIQDEVASLAASIAATTARLLMLIAELDRRQAWAEQGFLSLAHWLSWRTALALGPAREHVRVALALPELPLIAGAMAAGELSYSKVRALTRVARPHTEGALLDMARCATASQLERIVRGVRRADSATVEQRRCLQTFFDEDGMLVVRGRLAPEEGALFLRALEQSCKETEFDRAAALALMADRSLAAPDRNGGDRTQVVVHIDAEVLADPAADGQSQLDDGPGVPAETSRRLACDASIVTMRGGEQVGRKTRVFSAALRRALHLRDRGTCRFPACTHRLVDAHHVIHWADGGPTDLGNAVLLCRRHHRLVHEGGYQVSLEPDGPHFFDPRGREVVQAPPLPGPSAPAGRPMPFSLAPLAYQPRFDLARAVELAMGGP